MALWSSQSAHARRVALVIGNSAYTHVPALENPRNDARDLAKTLREIGFDSVDLKEDLEYRGMRIALRDFATKSQGAEITLIFYAGHSIELNKKNYLVPVDAKLAQTVDVDFEAIQLDQVRTAASSASKLKMVILDACRNNPFKMAGRSGTRSVGRGLTIVEARTDECQRRSNFAAVGRSKSTSLTTSKKAPDIGGLLACRLISWQALPGVVWLCVTGVCCLQVGSCRRSSPGYARGA